MFQFFSAPQRRTLKLRGAYIAADGRTLGEASLEDRAPAAGCLVTWYSAIFRSLPRVAWLPPDEAWYMVPADGGWYLAQCKHHQ